MYKEMEACSGSEMMKRRESRSDVPGRCCCFSTKRLSPGQKPGQRYGDGSVNWRTGAEREMRGSQGNDAKEDEISNK